MALRELVTPPVFVDGDELGVYRCVHDAELDLEPWYITDGWLRAAYDSEGRLLQFSVVKEVPQSLFRRFVCRILGGPIERVKLTGAERIPTHQPELRQVLQQVVKASGTETMNVSERTPLSHLIRKVLQQLGYADDGGWEVT